MNNSEISSSTNCKKNNENIAISVRELSKIYSLYERPIHFLKEIITGKKCHQEFWALKNINFDIHRGEVVGIIGSNGAGKSTLLKILAGTLTKTSGEMVVNGKISAILELGTGFHPDYTGRQNIIMGCMCLGMSRQTAESKLESIIDFSEIRSVIDQPFKTYSSGMQARLTFSTAISISPDILIIDEALAAGDSYFAAKCGGRIRDICKSGATVLIVSHSSHQIAQLCDRAIWIENGMIRDMGEAKEISKKYDYEVHKKISQGRGEVVTIEINPLHQTLDKLENHGPCALSDTPLFNPKYTTTVFRRGPAIIDKVEFLNKDEKPEIIFRTWETMIIRVWYRCEHEISDATLGLAIGIERENDYTLVCQFSTCNVAKDEDINDYFHANYRSEAQKSGYIQATVDKLQILEGKYIVSLGLIPNAPCAFEFYEYHHRTYPLNIQRNGFPSGAIFYPEVTWLHSSEVRNNNILNSPLENIDLVT